MEAGDTHCHGHSGEIELICTISGLLGTYKASRPPQVIWDRFTLSSQDQNQARQAAFNVYAPHLFQAY